MTDKFQIGEVAIYVRPGSPYYGKEITILSNLILAGPGHDNLYNVSTSGGYPVYQISELSWAPGKIQIARPEWLRKKKLPRREVDQVTTWDKCLWKPKEVEKYAQNNN